MFSTLLDWASAKPALRRPFMLLWRRAWRLRRATLARAVLIIRDGNGRVLVLSPEPLRLPSIDVHGWDAITTQAEDGLRRLVQASAPSLIAIDGTPGPEGVTFLYGATCDGDASSEEHLWLDPDLAVSCLTKGDSRLLRLCVAPPCNAP